VEGVRDVHQQLLVGIAAELWLGVQSLIPGLFADLASRTRSTLVQCVDGVKVDLSVEAVLQGRRNIVRVIMGAMGIAVVVTVTFVFVVAVRHDAGSALLDGCLILHMFARWLSGFENPSCPFMSLVFSPVRHSQHDHQHSHSSDTGRFEDRMYIQKTKVMGIEHLKQNNTAIQSCAMSHASIGSAPLSTSRSLARLAARSFADSLGASTGTFGMGAMTPSCTVLGILSLFASAARASSSSSTSSSSWLVILVPSISLISYNLVSVYAMCLGKREKRAFWYAWASSFSPRMSSTRSRPPISL
jgi:hypothetical protein